MMTDTTTAGRVYRYHRKRGLAAWRPQKKTADLLEHVNAVLDEYSEHLPLTARQVFYRLVGAHGYEKTELAYERLTTILVNARRAGMVAFDAIRDDGVIAEIPIAYDGEESFWDTVTCIAGGYRRDRLEGQRHAVELWVEAGGMVPQAALVADPYGVPVYSCGGFDSLTVKHDAAQRALARSVPTMMLRVGDFDPSGVSIHDSFADDVAALTRDLGRPGALTFKWIAVTPEQVDRFRLPTAPPKKTDKRGEWTGDTVQAEALPPDTLAAEIDAALREVLDLDAIERCKAREEDERREVLSVVRGILHHREGHA